MAEKAAGAGAGGSGITLELVAKSTLLIIGLWALANGLWLARDVLFITFFALLVASFLSIFVEPLHKRGISRSLSAPLVLLVMFGLFVLFFLLSWPTLREQFNLIQQQLPPAIDRLQDWIDVQIAAVVGPLGGTDGGMERRLRSQMTTELGTLVGGTLPLLNTAIGAITGFALVVVAGMFIAISPRTYMRGIIVLVPRSHRRRAGEVLPEAGEALMQWMKGTAMAMAAVGIISAVGLSLIGVPAALALGLIAGILEFIPYIGPALSFVPATVVALAVSPEKALWVIGLYLLVQGLESNLLTPLLMKQMVKLPPALTLLFQTLMATLFGFLGLLLAVPILATGKILVEELYVEPVADEH
jgi:predicted PurR-regulated permease PerM